MDWFVNHLGNIASVVGSMTVVGSALIWVYNKIIAKPREERREKEDKKRHQQMLALITSENEPLNTSIKQLTEWLRESQNDRKQLNAISKVNSERIDEHEDELEYHDKRLFILEVKNGIHKVSVKGGDD